MPCYVLCLFPLTLWGEMPSPAVPVENKDGLESRKDCKKRGIITITNDVGRAKQRLKTCLKYGLVLVAMCPASN